MALRIDMASAEGMAEVFKRLAAGEQVALSDVSDIIDANEGWRLWMRFYGGDRFQSRYLGLWRDILSGEECHSSDPVMNMMDTAYRAILRSPASLQKKLRFVKEANLCSAVDLAQEYLPAGTVIDVNVWLVIDGNNGGSIIDETNFCLDVTDICPEAFDGFGMYGLAHELHHMGGMFWRNQDNRWVELLDEKSGFGLAVMLAESLMGEGSAKCFFDDQVNPGSIEPYVIEKYGPEAVPVYLRVLEASKTDLERKFGYISNLFARLMRNDTPYPATRLEVRSCFGMQDGQLPLDKVVGSDMVGTIVKAFGLGTFLQCMAHLRDFIPTYNRAASVLDKPTLPGDVVEQWERLWDGAAACSV